MLKLTNPGLRRNNVMVDSVDSCVSNTSKKFPWAPEMSFSKMVSQPRVLSKKSKSRIAFKQLQSFADTHCRRHFNKQMDVVNSDMQSVNFKSMSLSSFSDKQLAINPNQVKFKRVSCIFRFPDKMESILPEAVFKTFQIHFSSPEDSSNYLQNLVREDNINPRDIQEEQEIKFNEDGNSSPCLKAEVSLPLM